MNQRLYYVAVFDVETGALGIDVNMTKEKFPLRAYNAETGEWEKPATEIDRHAAKTLLAKLSGDRGPDVRREDIVTFVPNVTDSVGDTHESLIFHSFNRFTTMDNKSVRLNKNWRKLYKWGVQR